MANAKKEPTAISLVDAQAAIDRRERSTSITQFTPKKKGRVIKKRQSTNNIYNYHSPSNYPQSPPMDSISRGNSYLGGKLMPPMLSDLSRSTSNPATRRLSKRRLDPVKERFTPILPKQNESGFAGLDTSFSKVDVELKRAIYFNPDNEIYRRLFPPGCYTPRVTTNVYEPRPMLKAASSLGLKRGNTPYKGIFGSDHPSNKLMVRQNSFNIRGRSRPSSAKLSGLGGPSSFDIKNGGAKSYGGTMDSYTYNINSNDDIDMDDHLQLNGDCPTDKTIPIIEVMTIGAKNNRKDLMHTINDINSRLIYHNRFSVDLSPQFQNAKSLPITSRNLADAAIDENKEQIVRKSNTDIDTLIINNKSKSNPINRRKRNLSRSGSISSRSSNNSFHIDSFTPYNALTPITNLKIDAFTSIERLHSALRQYHSLLAPPLDFNPEYIIKDNKHDIIDIIKITTHFIKPFVNTDGMPFQVDLMIIPREVDKADTDLTPESDPELISMSAPEESDSDDSDPDIDPFGPDEEDLKTEGEDIDYLGTDVDIGKLLKHGLHKHHHDHFEEKRIPFDRSKEGIKEHLDMMKNRMVQVLRKSTQNGRYVLIVDRRKNKPKEKEFKMMVPKLYNVGLKKHENNQNDKNKQKQNESNIKNKSKDQEKKPNTKKKGKGTGKGTGKMRGKKKSMKIKVEDIKIPKLNKEETEKYEKMDDMYFFQPCKPFGDLTDHNTMIEILHLNTLECLLPKPMDKDKDIGIDEEEKKDPKDEKNGSNKNEDDMDDERYIGASDLCKGNMFVVSFHILSMDEIRCYLYVDKKYMRINISNDVIDGDNLKTLIGQYVKSDDKEASFKREKGGNKNKSDEEDYNNFAFETSDRQFDEDFRWTQSQSQSQQEIR